MIIFKHALNVSFAQPINLLIIIILPIAIIFIPPNASNYPFGLYLYGYLSLFSAFLLCKPIVEERNNKIAVRISATPISYLSYLSSHLLAYLLILSIQSMIFVLGSSLYWNGIAINYVLVYSLYFVYNIMAIAFCLCWNSLFKTYNIAFALFSGGASLLCLVSGISIPLSVIPEDIRRFTIFLPTYWLPYGLNALSNGIMNYIIISHIILFVYAGILLLIGSRRRF
jgi:ABC-2 type transport system permease protein